MPQRQITDFLNPGIDQIRQSIRDIDDSYNNDWDIVAELCQNAVDAIRKSEITEGIIKLKINAQRKAITIYDNGIGIAPDSMEYLLKPFSTDKRDDPESIGEKGVGLTFVMFSGNKFIIKSGRNTGAKKGIILNAALWKLQSDNEPLRLELNDLNEGFVGTEVTIEDIQNTQLFELNFKQIKFLIRTRTALGSTRPIWGEDRNISIELSFTDINGQTNREDLPFRYLLPYEILPTNSKMDYDEFIEFARQTDRTDMDKRNKLRDKVIFRKSEFTHSNVRIIKYVACFVPKRKVWNKISLEQGLCTQENLDDEGWIENFGYLKFAPGIFSSVKGMPTRIITDNPKTGAAGYWQNIFILFEDKSLKFDIGRKSLHGRQAKILKDYAHDIFNDFSRSIVKYVSGEPETNLDFDREETFAEIKGMLDINIPDIKLKKTPKDQEASVAALFFECIGNGKITEILRFFD